jgi:hypothetical protein
MKPLFIGEFCPNDCDRKKAAPAHEALRLVHVQYDGTDPRLQGRPGFRQSGCWRPTLAGGARVLCCRLCGEELFCGPEDANGWFGAICKGQMAHQVVILNDEF